MSKKRDASAEAKAISRRDFLKKGAAAGIGAAVLAGTTAATAHEHGGHHWDYEVDVLVVGGGATGLPAAIRARDLGNDVMIVEQNFDLGGVMLHSAAWVSLGGGDPIQERDLRGDGDPDGFVTVAPLEQPDAITDDVDLLFKDMTDWSVVDRSAQAPYRYNERDLHRAWADNCYDTRTFLMQNYVRFSRISGTHGTGGISRARRAVAILKEGDTTDMRAGTVTVQDAGVNDVSTSHFAPAVMGDGTSVAGPGVRHNGAALARPLEWSAREKGVQIMLNRRMVELIREEPFAGRVLGIKATYTPRFDPDTGVRLESLWQQGNVDERAETITIRARKAVVVGTGGHSGNPQFRSMFYPALRDPHFVTSGWALLGPGRGRDGSGIIAAMKIGANLSGMQQNLSYATTFHVQPRIGTRDAYTPMLPGHPTFPFRRSTGINVPVSARQHLITVNQVGKRFFNELDFVRSPGSAQYPGTGHVPNPGTAHVAGDWRNSRVSWIRESFNRFYGMDAALAVNEGSQAPEFFPGPTWAIFDAAAVERAGWRIEAPFVDEHNGMFFKADTIEELAEKIHAGYEHQRMPLTYLKETVDKWNAAVDAGVDEEFERGPDAPMHKIMTPPFYAAINMIIWHDSYGGLRINGHAQVVDMQGDVIPGLYSGGEASGGGNQHGLGRAIVHGFIAGTNAHAEPVA
jgi:hypothetical protein